jgi:hypothetical protein
MSARIICALAAAAFMGSGSPALVAQSANVAPKAAEFEVASVKLHTSDDQRMMMVAQPGGRFVAANIPLRLLIRTAFQLQDDQIVGGPNWLATDRFDIEARSPASPGGPSYAHCARHAVQSVHAVPVALREPRRGGSHRA